MKIILIGFMGSGKTSIAAELSVQLQLPRIEMDELVCEKVACNSVPDVFAKGGELLWRETEIEIAREHRYSDNLIVSTGGGVIQNKIIVDYLKEKQGRVFYLHASFEEIEKRIKHCQLRPLFQNKAQAKALYASRLPLYERYADHIIDVDGKSVAAIAAEIIQLINLNDKRG